MRRHKQTIIKTETREIFIIRRNTQARLILWCAECHRETEWLGLPETAQISSCGLREIFRLVEAGALHFQETSQGRPFVCADSLALAFRN